MAMSWWSASRAVSAGQSRRDRKGSACAHPRDRAIAVRRDARPPALAAELDGGCARLAGLAEDAQARDALDQRETRDAPDAAERPRRRVAEPARGERGLDALADM